MVAKLISVCAPPCLCASHVSNSGLPHRNRTYRPSRMQGMRSCFAVRLRVWLRTQTNRTIPLTCLPLSTMIPRMGTPKNPHAQALGSLGGSARARKLSPARRKKIASEGGKGRARKLSAAQLSEIAKRAVAARERKRAQARRGGNK